MSILVDFTYLLRPKLVYFAYLFLDQNWSYLATYFVGGRCSKKPNGLSTLSQKSETVSQKWDSLTFLRQCRQALRLPRFEVIEMKFDRTVLHVK